MRDIVALVLLALSIVMLVACGREEGRAQEGSVIVFHNADGRTLSLEDLRSYSGSIRYEIIGSNEVPVEATALHQRAREAGGQGEYQRAIDLLSEASELAPQWPYPVYDKAFTYLLMDDFEAARAHYEITLELAPRGFFTAITAFDVLTREQNGEFEPGIYQAYLSLEWMGDVDHKEQILRQLVERFPTFAPAWKDLANLTDDDADRLAAIENGLAAEPDAETRGILLINKAVLMNSQGDYDASIRLLGELALDPRATLATEHLAKSTMAMIVSK